MNYTKLSNPYLNKILLKLRSEKTQPPEFRILMEKLGELCAYEISKDLPVEEQAVETPLKEIHGDLGIAKASILKRDSVGLISMLRAAIPFIQGFVKVFEDAPTAIISAKRGKQNGTEFEIISNYSSGLNFLHSKYIIIPDPMLASGSTVNFAINLISKDLNPKGIIICSAIAASFGIEKINKAFPNVKIYTGEVDNKLNKGLNDHGYIVPGLGDAGDRAFGTF